MSIVDIIAHGLFLNKGSVFLLIGAVVSIIVPYLLGSINFAIIISSREYKQDIRTYGSGNAGMTNMMRTYGNRAAGLTLIGDALKAVVSCIIGYLMLGYVGASIAGLFCVIGHMFPCFYRFKGGKGVVTGAVAMLMCDPITFVIVLLIFIIIVAFTKYISLGSIMGALLYPIILDRVYKIVHGTYCPFIIFALLMSILIVLKHWDNIKRLMKGKENKFSFKRSKKNNSEPAPDATAEAPVSEDSSAPQRSEKKKKLNKNYGKKKK